MFLTIPPGELWTPEHTLFTLLDDGAAWVGYAPIAPGDPTASSWRASKAWNSPAAVSNGSWVAEQVGPPPR